MRLLYEGRVVGKRRPAEQGPHDRAATGDAPFPAWLRGTFIGAPFGCIPAGGTEIPTFLELCRRKEAVEGKTRRSSAPRGAIEGVAGPEAANNATVTAALIPLLTLGIPTSNTTAILLGAFQNYGIQPGPQLFTRFGRAGVGADRLAVHRQRDAAGAEPAAWWVCGSSC